MRARIALVATATSLILCAAAEGIFVNTSVPVPMDRIERNLTRLIEKRPRDGRLHSLLGRIHAMKLANREAPLRLVMPDGDDGAPELPPWTELVERQRPKELDEAGRRRAQERPAG